MNDRLLRIKTNPGRATMADVKWLVGIAEAVSEFVICDAASEECDHCDHCDHDEPHDTIDTYCTVDGTCFGRNVACVPFLEWHETTRITPK